MIALRMDPRVAPRARRLVFVSAIVLGAIAWYGEAAAYAAPLAPVALTLGWLLMPLSLMFSPRARLAPYGLALAATATTLGLAAVASAAFQAGAPAAPAWGLILSGVVLGDVMGSWFWFRLVPVPGPLEAPGSGLRMLAIGLHVALIAAGLVLLVTAGRGA